MPTLNELMLGMLGKGVESGSAAVGKLMEKKQDLFNKLAEQQNAVDTLNKWKDNLPEGAGAKVGDVSFTRGYDPRTQRKAEATEAKNLYGVYGKRDADIASQADVLQNGLNGLQSGTPEGYKQSAAALARLVEGKSARIQLPVIKGFTNRDSYANAQDFLNYVANNAAGNLSEEHQKALKGLYAQHLQRLDSDHEGQLGELQGQAPSLAPSMSAAGTLTPYVQTFGQASGKKLKAAHDTLDQIKEHNTNNVSPGFIGHAQDWLSQHLGGSAGASAPAEPVAPTGPPPGMSKEQFKAWKATQKK